MVSILNSTANLVHRTPLPTSITREQAIALLRDHDFLIHLDPELSHYTVAEAPADANPATKYYQVTDIMHTLPKGLWDSTVSFNSEMTDVENGCDWIIRAPLGIYQRSKWLIEDALETDGEGEHKLCLVEDTSITCTRLLVGVVKGKCEANWKGTHERFVDRLMAKDQ
ncbi:hypothetical protein NA57DRAFT_78378 [Rhizodiscina lignyota]|uniref:DUF7053 domain-containing protein n=1 Tax=Rhizodiscina lignyota TaxID=1504668 RepID=A0A9P4I856_9PEZI|nr:hypothetical protein NA57DRAFT_78378 [Rhizodiscina lignyota]